MWLSGGRRVGCRRERWRAGHPSGAAVSDPAPAWRPPPFGPGGPPVSAGWSSLMQAPQGPAGSVPLLVDVHGAGAQRSDPKAGDPAMFPHGRGPQGDVIRIYNFVRLVRGGLN